MPSLRRARTSSFGERIVLDGLAKSPDRSAKKRMAVFDGMPPSVRDALDYSTCDINSLQVGEYLMFNGEAATRRAIRNSEIKNREMLARLYEGKGRR